MNTNASTPDRSRANLAAPTSGIQTYASLAGRLLLAVLFLITGFGKIGAYAATAGYMESVGVPGALLPVVIATEILGGIALVLGWKTRIAAFLLAGFSVLAALLFHNNLGDQVQFINFLKNVAIAGGMLLLVANGPGPLSLDGRVAK